MIFTITPWEKKGNDDGLLFYGLRMIYKRLISHYLWLSLFKFRLAITHPRGEEGRGSDSVSPGVRPSLLRGLQYILVSAFLADTPLLWVCLEHFVSPMRAVHGKHRVMERRGEKAERERKKKIQNKVRRHFFWSSFPVCWHELKAHCPALTKKNKKTPSQ